ncbi:Kinesin, motor domain and P-loop containing nucleoside triphosphate hydrolase domain-containing protein [Strongyloides ratti]|uniref:Kinesin, motor domain and P-loop containing nucleoside triphosphate hydrolase domain-containing protein n=1 Tax=Strongyloides ratti TaxID=34506 RepID=A0A090LBM1_STRRB|nr:Kinesin, motor domain and P-loop containing nucleoside triphosphate hydrolase domain-containing protein [Strongyloides ratti]CEF67161.1 Kinesin, motor domain and P-loop containing nucleoside triphosphate hydrolase domain-containing protein [Strongyloides ratti]
MSSSVNSAKVIICLKNKHNGNVTKKGKVEALTDNTLKVHRPKLGPQTFGPFNKIFDDDVNHQRIFYEAVKIHADEGFNGIKSFIISYGFSSSGKTDLMFGSDIKELGGILRETLEYISKKKNQDIGSCVDFYYSVFEICGDKIFDLLSDERKEISIVSDDGNKLVVKDSVVLPLLDIKTSCSSIRNALNRKSLASNVDFEIVARSHVLVKLKIVTKNKCGVINYGELVFLDLSSTNLIMDLQDKSINLEIKAVKMGYVSLNTLLEKILKNPLPSQSFRESMLTRILRPALSGAYTSSMVFTVTMDHVPQDALQSLDIADKYRRLKCCSLKESLISLEVRRNIKNIRIPLCDVKEIELIGLVPTNTKSKEDIQTLHREIEKNKKQYEIYTDMLSKIEIDYEESSKICNEKSIQHDYYLKEKKDAINQLTKINCDNCELKSKVDKLKIEIASLLTKLSVLQETFGKYFDKLEKIKNNGLCLLDKNSFLDNAHTEMNDNLSYKVKDLEDNYLQTQVLSKELINKQEVFMKELDDQYRQDKNNFRQVEIALQSYCGKLNEYSKEFELSVKGRLPPDVRNELYDKVSKLRDVLLVTIEEARNKCEIKENECFTNIEKIIKDEKEKVINLFTDYKESLLQEFSNTQEAISACNTYGTKVELIGRDIDDVKKILEEVNSVKVPTIDMTSLNLPPKEECIVDENAISNSSPRLSTLEKPHIVNEVSYITKKILGENYHNRIQDEENKENL